MIDAETSCRLSRLTEQLLEISNELIEGVADPTREQALRAQRQELLAAKQALDQTPVQPSIPSMPSMHSSSAPFGQGYPASAPATQPMNGAFGMPGSGFAPGGGVPSGQMGGLEPSFPGGGGMNGGFSGEPRPPPAPLDRSVAAMQQDCR